MGESPDTHAMWCIYNFCFHFSFFFQNVLRLIPSIRYAFEREFYLWQMNEQKSTRVKKRRRREGNEISSMMREIGKYPNFTRAFKILFNRNGKVVSQILFFLMICNRVWRPLLNFIYPVKINVWLNMIFQIFLKRPYYSLKFYLFFFVFLISILDS